MSLGGRSRMRGGRAGDEVADEVADEGELAPKRALSAGFALRQARIAIGKVAI